MKRNDWALNHVRQHTHISYCQALSCLWRLCRSLFCMHSSHNGSDLKSSYSFSLITLRKVIEHAVYLKSCVWTGSFVTRACSNKSSARCQPENTSCPVTHRNSNNNSNSNRTVLHEQKEKKDPFFCQSHHHHACWETFLCCASSNLLITHMLFFLEDGKESWHMHRPSTYCTV